jgi:RNA polymerase sigma-70 factor (ECF subfamily)
MDGPDADGRFGELARNHYAAVVAYARRRLSDWHTAEDLAAETFVVAWRRLDDVPPEPRPWLYAVARGLLLNEYRRLSRWRRADREADDLPDPNADPAAGVAGADRVRRALAGLREPDRELLMLIGWEQISVAEAAKVLNLSPARLSVRLHRARARLARRLEIEEGTLERL